MQDILRVKKACVCIRKCARAVLLFCFYRGTKYWSHRERSVVTYLGVGAKMLSLLIISIQILIPIMEIFFL